MTDLTYQNANRQEANGSKYTVGNKGVFCHESGGRMLTTDGIGSCAALGTPTQIPGTVSIVEEKIAQVHRTILTLTNVVVPTVDATTNGAQGTWLAYLFPRGLIEIFGATDNLTIAGDGTGITATSAVVSSVGSVVAATDATLTSTEADMIPSFAATLVASAGVVKGLGQTSKFFDNTTNTNATQLTANLNFACPDAGSTANGTITVNGTITINWFNHGDN